MKNFLVEEIVCGIYINIEEYMSMPIGRYSTKTFMRKVAFSAQLCLSTNGIISFFGISRLLETSDWWPVFYVKLQVSKYMGNYYSYKLDFDNV